jgi:group I intron endonuclease
MYGIIYKTTCIINGKIYVGQTISKDLHYLGSGTKITDAIKKYGRENFKRETLKECDNQKLLDVWEMVFIKKLRATNPRIGYNILPGSANGFGQVNPSSLPEVRKKISESAMGRKISKKTKLAVSLCHKGVKWDEQRRNKLSATISKRKSITNGLKNSWLLHGQEMPEGWRYGRLPYRVKRKKRKDRINYGTNSGMIWINNGIENKMIFSTNPIPDGWYKGMKK